MNKTLSFIIALLFSFGVSQTSANPCRGLYFGEVVANPERCDQYYICIFAQAVPGQCDPLQVFDPTVKRCVTGDPETCYIGEITTTQRPTETSTIPVTSTETNPTDIPSTVTVSTIVPSTETSSTVVPSTVTVSTVVPSTETSPTVVPSTVTTPTIVTSTSTPSTTPQPVVDLEEICKGVFFSAKPYPNSLTIFVGCIRERGALFFCSENEFFHPVINECLKWPESTANPSTTTEGFETTVVDTTTKVPETSTVIVETTTTLPETTSAVPETTTTDVPPTTQSPLEIVCEGKFFEYAEHPTDCALFVFCYEERYLVRMCPENTIFDISTSLCKFGNQETCEFFPENTIPITEPTRPTTTEGSTVPDTTTTEAPPTTTEAQTTTEIPTTTTEFPTTTAEIPTTTVFRPCAGIDNGVVPNEENCTQFFRCVMQEHRLSQCGQGFIFDRTQLFCVPGDAVTCTPT